MSRDRAVLLPSSAVVIQPVSRLAVARDIAIIAVCVALLAGILLGGSGEPLAEPAAAQAAEAGQRL